MSITECKICKRLKTVQPWRCSRLETCLCDRCRNNSITEKPSEAVVVEDKRSKTVLRLKPIKYGG